MTNKSYIYEYLQHGQGSISKLFALVEPFEKCSVDPPKYSGKSVFPRIESMSLRNSDKIYCGEASRGFAGKEVSVLSQNCTESV